MMIILSYIGEPGKMLWLLVLLFIYFCQDLGISAILPYL